MRVKILQIGKFYIRLDITVMHGYNVLLGFNYCEGMYSACKDDSFKDCQVFDYSEFQIGLLLLTINIGREVHNPGYEQHN